MPNRDGSRTHVKGGLSETSGDVPDFPLKYSQIAGRNYGRPVTYGDLLGLASASWGLAGSRGMGTLSELLEQRKRLIASRLVGRCEELGVSQNQLARMLDVPHKMVWRWWHAEHAPLDRHLRDLEDKLDVPEGYFTCDHDQENAA